MSNTIKIFPNSALNEVRLNIGDPTGEYITDDVISFILTQNDNDVNLSSVKAAEYILKNLARLKDETVGPISIKWSQVYKNYKELYNTLMLDVGSISENGQGLFFFGGTLKSNNDAYEANSDNVGSPVKVGFASKSQSPLLSTKSVYNLERD